MNQEELQKQIALYYAKLPREVQEMFAKMEWLESLKGISTRYGLSDEQIQSIGTETTLVLLGIIHADEYEGKIRDELGLSKENADKMLAEINEGILKNIRPQLIETFSKNVNEIAVGDSEIIGDLDERFDKLPQEIKKILLEMDYNAKIYAVAQENKLTITQMSDLEGIVTKVITNVIHPDDFERALRDTLRISDEIVKKLSEKINADILRPIREKMEKIYVKPKNTLYDIKPITKNNNYSPIASNIKITKPDLNIPELKKGDPEIDQKMTPITTQKLSGSVASSTVKTDYSLKADPYRIMPE